MIRTEQSIMEKFNNLDQNGKVQAYYMWVDGSGQFIRYDLLLSNYIFFFVCTKSR